VTDVAEGSQESNALSGIAGGLSLLVQEGDQLLGDDGVAGAAELTHDQLGVHVQAQGGVDAGLVDQTREGEGSGDLELTVGLDSLGLEELLYNYFGKIS